MIRNRIEGMQHLQLAATLLLHAAVFICLFGAISKMVPDYAMSVQQLATLGFLGLLGYSALNVRTDATCWEPVCLRVAPALFRALRQTLAIVLPIFILLMAVSEIRVPGLLILSYAGLVFLTCLATNHYLPRLLARVLFSGRYRVRMLLVGNRGRARRLNRWLRSAAPYGFHVAGIVSDTPDSRRTCGYPCLGGTSNIEKLLRDEHIEQVILLEIPLDPAVRERLIEATERAGVRLLILDDSRDRCPQAISRFTHMGRDFLCVREEPLESPLNRILKRILDVAISLPVVLFILPIVSLLVRIRQGQESRGPLFFRQTRSGTKRKTFTILKFRTMHSNNQSSRQATENDDRVFPTGKFLRRTSLDELPQFWNVLCGAMSVVGPRPHMMEHDDEFAKVMSSYHVRSYAKPGITGLAQVRGFRGEAKSGDDIRNRVACDVEYIERWSLGLDILIIMQTALQVVRPPRTAY